MSLNRAFAVIVKLIFPFPGGATTAWELRVEGRLIDEIENPTTAAAATPKTGGKVDPSKSKRKFSSFFKVNNLPINTYVLLHIHTDNEAQGQSAKLVAANGVIFCLN